MKKVLRRRGLAHISELDGLRGLAILVVLAFHLGGLSGGYLGVDLFFVLSGFLITSLLVHEKETQGSISIRRFWIRRSRRLLPALLFFLIVVGGAVLIYGETSRFLRFRNDMVSALFYFANWRFIFAEYDYWALFSSPSPLVHTWSLAIEEQFYLIWPIIFVWIFSFSRNSFRRLRQIAFSAAIFSAFLFIFMYSQNNEVIPRIYYGTDTRISAILLGATLALAPPQWMSLNPLLERLLPFLTWVSVTYLIFSWFLLSGDSPFLYQGGLLLNSLSALVIISTILQRRSPIISKLLIFLPLRCVGLISYGLYLWHLPIFLLIDENYSWLEPVESLTIKLVLTFSITIASYLLLESPIRKRKTSSRTNWMLFFLAIVCISGESYLLTRNAVVLPLQTDFSSVNLKHEPVNNILRILVVGDSMAVNLALGLSDKNTGVLRVSGDTGCGILGNVNVKQHDGRIVSISNCGHIFFNWKRKLISFKPNVVILMYGGPLTERLINSVWTHPCETAFDTAYRIKLQSAVELLSSTGAVVLLPTMAYSLMKNDNNYVFHRRLDCLNEIFRNVSALNRGVNIVELGGFVCPSHYCRTKIDGITLRSDGLHYSNDGAKLIYGWLVNELNYTLIRDKQIGGRKLIEQ